MTRPHRIAMVAHASIPSDPRVRRQADALLEAGYEVDILGLREPGQAPEEEAAGLRLIRLPVGRGSTGFVGHLAEYAAFTALAAWRLAREHRRRRYDLVQVHTLPDFLVAAAGATKLAGVPLLLDLHEDMPTFFDDRFAAPALRPLRPVLRGVSKAATTVADHVLTVHEPIRRLVIERGLDPDKITVVMNSADERLFDPAAHPRRPFMADGTLRLVHHSSLQRIYGLEVAVEAVARASRAAGAPPMRLDVYGDGPYRPQIEDAIGRHGAGDLVTLHGRVPMDALPALIADADIGLVPSLPEPYMQLSLSTKLLEYAAMGVPVIASDLATFREHLDGDALTYVPGGDAAALADAIAMLAADPTLAARRTAEAQRQVAAYAWSRQREIYLGVVTRLIGAKTAPTGGGSPM
jgi:glycosyltransferase involved in cell wall biosynthesis